MAVNRYKCDTCKREIELVENSEGIDKVQRCIITKGCHGILFLERRFQNFNRPAKTPKTDLPDYFPRKGLYTHEQTLPSKEWIVNHNFEGSLLFDVVTGYEGSYTEASPTVEYLNNKQVRLTFPNAEVGLAQVISRSPSTPEKFRAMVKPDTSDVQISSRRGLISLATKNKEFKFPMTITMKNETGTDVRVVEYNLPRHRVSGNPWNGTDKVVPTAEATVYVNGKSYAVRALNLINDAPKNIQGKLDDGYTITDITIHVTTVVIEENQQTTKIISRKPRNDEVLILTTESPYSVVDTNKTQYIDLDDFYINSIYTKGGEAYSKRNILTKEVFPEIIYI